VNRQNKITTKISVAIAGIYERYTCNITQQDAPRKDRILPPAFADDIPPVVGHLAENSISLIIAL
jgi:hypothetical protein